MSSSHSFIQRWNQSAVEAANRHGVFLVATGDARAHEQAPSSVTHDSRFYNQLSGREKAQLRADDPALWAAMRAAPNPPVTWNELRPLQRAQLRAEDADLAERMAAAPDGPERWAPPGEYI
jgi:hypothetical protein